MARGARLGRARRELAGLRRPAHLRPPLVLAAGRRRARLRRRSADQRRQLRAGGGGLRRSAAPGSPASGSASARSPTTRSTALIAATHRDRPRPPGPSAGKRDRARRWRSAPSSTGSPSRPVLGINIAAGNGVGVALLVAIFVSNLPEAMGSADDMRKAGTARGEDPAPLARRRRDLHPRHRRRLRCSPTRRAGDPQGRDRRLRRRGAAGDADRLDDPRRARGRRPPRRPRHRPRLRRRRRPLQSLLALAAPPDAEAPVARSPVVMARPAPSRGGAARCAARTRARRCGRRRRPRSRPWSGPR